MKSFVFVFFILTTVFASGTAHAISNEKLLARCEATGVQAVLDKASASGCKVDASMVRVSDVDNRWYNPSAYIWYTADVQCGDEPNVTVLLQYSNGQCF